MKNIKPLGLALLGAVTLSGLYFAMVKPLHWSLTPYAFAKPVVDEYAKQTYDKYAINDLEGDKVTAQKGFAWRNETWSGDDEPYRQARNKIEAALASGASLDEIIDEAENEARKNPKSPLAQFRWAYAVWKMPAPAVSTSIFDKNALGAFFALAYTVSPNTYNFARLRYLLTYQYQEGKQVEVGERLLQRDAKDLAVKGHLALDYTGSDPYDTKSKSRAVQLSNELIQAGPKDARNHAILAEAYMSSYYRNGHHRQDAVSTVAALKKYLKLAKPTDAFYEQAKIRITLLGGELIKSK